MVDLREIHTELKVLLKEFHEICLTHGIKYSLSGGSLLGAIRENGFIPWDDDADVLMERQEYNKLLKILPEKYNIINVLWVPRLVYTGMSKMELGKSIDIFVLDNSPNSAFLHRIKVFRLRILQGMLKENIKWSDYSLIGKILTYGTFVLGAFVSKETKLRWYERLVQSHNNIDTKYLGNFKNEYSFLSMRYDKSMFMDYVFVPFEDIQLSVMRGYDRYLKMAYGDYMKRPAKEEQKPKHIQNCEN